MWYKIFSPTTFYWVFFIVSILIGYKGYADYSNIEDSEAVNVLVDSYNCNRTKSSTPQARVIYNNRKYYVHLVGASCEKLNAGEDVQFYYNENLDKVFSINSNKYLKRRMPMLLIFLITSSAILIRHHSKFLYSILK